MKRITTVWKSLLRYNTVKIAIAIAMILVGMGVVKAADYQSSGTVPDHIFKCQPSVISVNYTNIADIVSVNALVIERDGSQVSYSMQNMNGGLFQYTYGNDNTTKWGNKTINFQIMTANSSYINLSNPRTFVFVYSDECTGTGITSWRNTNTGLGNYTKPLFTGSQNIIQVAQQPYLNYWGYSIYILMMFGFMSILYLKGQSVSQPLLLGFLMIAALVSTGLVPSVYRMYILFFMAAAMAAIFWRLFKSA